MTTDANDVAPRRGRLPGIIGVVIGLGVGAAVAAGAVWYALAGPGVSPPSAEARRQPSREVRSADRNPTDDEVLAYLDGKPIAVKDPAAGNAARPPAVFDRAKVSELVWQSAGQMTGSENPWTHRYSFLYDAAGTPRIVDISVEVRVIGTQQAFLGLEVRKITPVEKLNQGAG